MDAAPRSEVLTTAGGAPPGRGGGCPAAGGAAGGPPGEGSSGAGAFAAPLPERNYSTESTPSGGVEMDHACIPFLPRFKTFHKFRSNFHKYLKLFLNSEKS